VFKRRRTRIKQSFFLNYFAFEDGKDSLSRKVGKELKFYPA
jgi:hypothetical protein